MMIYALNWENYHISKSDQAYITDPQEEAGMCDTIKELIDTAMSESDNHIMNDDISDHEVKSTFCKGSNCSGHDGISAKLIDNAERQLMHECLRILWNEVWAEGYFPSEWKKENRIVMQKPGNSHYNECNVVHIELFQLLRAQEKGWNTLHNRG